MLSLKELVRETGTHTVMIRGAALAVREITGAQRFKVRQVWPEPAPVWGPDPGEKGKYIVDPTNARYRDNLRNATRMWVLVDAAIGLGWVTADGLSCPGAIDDAVAMKTWGDKAAEEIAACFTERELGLIFAAASGEPLPQQDLPDAKKTAETMRKN